MSGQPSSAKVPVQAALLAATERVPLVQCGLDEVGRGALAGPLVAAAVVLPEDFAERLGPLVRFLRDSKTVPRRRREEVAELIWRHAPVVEVQVVPVARINSRGIGWANREAFRLLIGRVAADEYIVDGRVRPPAPRDRAQRVRCMVRADAEVPAVSAASLVAKVHRDALMCLLHERHPDFGWHENAGYGTPAHLAALRAHSPTSEHRTVFVTTALGGGQRARKTLAQVGLALLEDSAEGGVDEEWRV
jgi:ribonuclease HII